MKTLSPTEQIVNTDIMRYKPNRLPAMLALLSLVFNVLYFCLLYGFKNSFFSNWKIGASVVITLITLLFTFLASEGIKGYNKKYCITLIVLAVVQIARIFILPLQALANDQTGPENLALSVRYFGLDLSSEAYCAILIIWLSLSAACLIAAAVLGYINCTKLEKFNAAIESGEIDIDGALKEEEVETAANTEVK